MRTSIKEMNKRLDEREQVIEQLRIYNNELLEDKTWWSRKWKAENSRANNLQQKIDKVAFHLGHELYGHILQNDEKSWSLEYYTEGKLDYRKLLIKLLEEVFEILEVDGNKWYEYED